MLRIAAVLHMLFKLDIYDKEKNKESEADEDIDSSIEEKLQSVGEDTVISTSAILAAISFVKMACQQTAFMAGKKKLDEEI